MKKNKNTYLDELIQMIDFRDLARKIYSTQETKDSQHFQTSFKKKL